MREWSNLLCHRQSPRCTIRCYMAHCRSRGKGTHSTHSMDTSTDAAGTIALPFLLGCCRLLSRSPQSWSCRPLLHHRLLCSWDEAHTRSLLKPALKKVLRTPSTLYSQGVAHSSDTLSRRMLGLLSVKKMLLVRSGVSTVPLSLGLLGKRFRRPRHTQQTLRIGHYCMSMDRAST